jgi:hypothetical protein
LSALGLLRNVAFFPPRCDTVVPWAGSQPKRERVAVELLLDGERESRPMDAEFRSGSVSSQHYSRTSG